ncbi:hypothetical protein E1162_01230 [Rhodobacteraceae bacterium RKSG542]|uniref:SPOR domain-containing protein n=1 Tax=Pseudovibrio flavus TaxID=2529854 RepID=UPI0012BD3531|nr:SPOR domain-containing protein [Pseudovibrio flavus]MTI15857.1 hypothetical protein [Pseudovibrio flavus]
MSKRANYPMPGRENSERTPSKEPQSWIPDEDPLVELARIVGESATNYRPGSQLNKEQSNPLSYSEPVAEPTPQEAYRDASDFGFEQPQQPETTFREPEAYQPEQSYGYNEPKFDEPFAEPVTQPQASSESAAHADPFGGDDWLNDIFPQEPKKSTETGVSTDLGDVVPSHETQEAGAADFGFTQPAQVKAPVEPAPRHDDVVPAPASQNSASTATQNVLAGLLNARNERAAQPRREPAMERPVATPSQPANPAPSAPAFGQRVEPQAPVVREQPVQAPQTPAYAPQAEQREVQKPMRIGAFEPPVARADAPRVKTQQPLSASREEPSADFADDLSMDLESALKGSLSFGGEREPVAPKAPVSKPAPAAPRASDPVRRPVDHAGFRRSFADIALAPKTAPASTAAAPQPKASAAPIAAAGATLGGAAAASHHEPAPVSEFIPDFSEFMQDTIAEEPKQEKQDQLSRSLEAELLAELTGEIEAPAAPKAPVQRSQPAAQPVDSADDDFERELLTAQLRGIREQNQKAQAASIQIPEPAPIPVADPVLSADDLLAEIAPERIDGHGRAFEADSDDSEIDEMSWPAAAELLAKQDIEEEDFDQAPPPEGYDLDAVAMAMRQEDPSLDVGVLPESDEAEEERAPKRGGLRKALLAAASLLVVGGIGAAGFVLLDLNSAPSDNEPARVIKADSEPMKEFPVASAEPRQATANILKPTDGSQAPAGEVMVVQDTAVVNPLPPAPAESDATDGEALDMTRAKRVRTVVVRPDGTIVSADSQASQNTSAPKAVETTTIRLNPSESVALPSQSAGLETNTGSLIGTTAGGLSSGLAQPQETTSFQSAVSDALGTPETSADAGEIGSIGSLADVGFMPESKPLGGSLVPSTPTASVSGGPLRLTPQADTASQQVQTQVAALPSATSSAQSSLPSGGYIVQVSSVRSEDQAQGEIRALQNRHPELMGNVSPRIVQADLGDRGVYYRVRVPFAGATEANAFCNSLKNAGSDCFVRRN